MSYHGRAVIRWRACHVMGSAFKEKFRGALLDRVANDPDENVRYGAIRSLIELSSHSSELAGRLVEDLGPLLDRIAESPRVMTELTRAVFLSPGLHAGGQGLDLLETLGWGDVASGVVET